MGRTYEVPDGITRDEILDFYISELPPEWRWCLSYLEDTDVSGQIASGRVTGAYFIKGTTRVSVSTQDLYWRSGRMKPTYSISVDYKETFNPCQDEEAK